MIPEALFDHLFTMPQMPLIELPLPERIGRSIMQLIGFGFMLAFRAGVYQGFLFGSVFTVIVTQGIGLARRKEK